VCVSETGGGGRYRHLSLHLRVSGCGGRGCADSAGAGRENEVEVVERVADEAAVVQAEVELAAVALAAAELAAAELAAVEKVVVVTAAELAVARAAVAREGEAEKMEVVVEATARARSGCHSPPRRFQTRRFVSPHRRLRRRAQPVLRLVQHENRSQSEAARFACKWIGKGRASASKPSQTPSDVWSMKCTMQLFIAKY
jgi:hypothetical protein